MHRRQGLPTTSRREPFQIPPPAPAGHRNVTTPLEPSCPPKWHTFSSPPTKGTAARNQYDRTRNEKERGTRWIGGPEAYAPNAGGYAPSEGSGFEIFTGIVDIPTGGAIQLEDRLDMALKNAMRNFVFLALAAAQFAFDFNVRAFLQTGGEFTKLSEGQAATPFGAGFPVALRVLPRALCRD